MSVCQYQIQTYQFWDLIKTWGFREGLYIYMLYTYLVPKGKYIYFPRKNVVIFSQSQRLRGNIITFLREKYIYSPEEQDIYSIHIFFKRVLFIPWVHICHTGNPIIYIPAKKCIYGIYVSCSAGYICICSSKECCYIFTKPKAEGKYNNIPDF